MRKKLLTFVFCLLITILVIGTACTPVVHPDNPPITKKDPFYTDGYTKGETGIDSMMSDLVNSSFNSLYPLTEYDKSTGDKSLSATMRLKLNTEILDIVFRLNFSHNNVDNNVMNIEIRKPNEPVLLGLYYFKGKEKSDFFLKIENNNIHIPIATESVAKILPLEYENKLKLEMIAILSELVVPVDKIKYESRTSGDGGVYRHYYAKINLLESLKKVMIFADIFQYDSKELDYILSNLLGLTLDKSAIERFPETYIDVEFTSYKGMQGDVTQGSIYKLKLDIDVAACNNANTVFDGKAFKGTLDLQSIEIGNSALKNLKKREDFSSYVNFGTKAFRLSGQLIYPNVAQPHNFKFDYQHDKIDINDSKFDIRVTKSDGGAHFILRYDDGTLYMLTNDNGIDKEINIQFDYNLFTSLFLTKFNNREVDFIKNVVYLIGALELKDSLFSYNFVIKNLNAVLDLSTDALIDMLDAASSDNVEELLQQNDINIEKLLSRIFTLTIPTDRPLIQPIPAVE